jgi:hypothetical protein
MFVGRVRAVSVYSQSIKDGSAGRGCEVSIRRTANLRFAQLEV